MKYLYIYLPVVRIAFILQVILVALLPATVKAGLLKGKVTDNNGQPLPYATIYVQGTTTGTAANANAEYELQLPAGKYKIVCQYMGFQQVFYSVTITGSETIKHDFNLSEQALKMQDVVVKAGAEDPAYAIIRRAIKKRKFHKEQVEAFQSSIYMKVVIRNRELPSSLFGMPVTKEDLESISGGGGDSTKLGVVYLSEQEADYYSDGKRERTIIRSVRESGNPNGIGISRMPPVVSFYDNNVNPLWNLGERGFISPISDGALNYYRYKYEGEFLQDGFTINKITVTPRRQYEPLFYGTIYIVDEDWAIHSLNLTLTKKSNLTEIDTLRIEQTYLPLKKDTWVIKSQVQYPTISMFGFGFTANFVAIYDNQKVNEPLPDSFFEDRIISSYKKDAQDKDTGHWKEQRPVPLEADEVQDYRKKDSTYALYTSPAYMDSMRKVRNKFRTGDIFMDGFYYASKNYKNTYRTNSLLNGLVTYNNVEGIAVKPKLWWTHRIDTGKIIYGTGSVRYGFGNTHFNPFGRFSYRQYDRKWLTRYWEAGIEGGKYIYQFNPQSTVEPLYNTISVLFYGKNLMHLYERYTAAGFFTRNYGNGFRWTVKTGFQRRIPVQNSSFYTFANNEPEKWRDNTPATLQNMLWEPHNAVLAKAALSYQPGVRYVQYPKFRSPVHSIWPVFTISYDKGIPGIADSKTDFDKWRFGIVDYVNMKLLGSIEYNVAVGGFLNNTYTGLPDMMHIADNELLIAAPYISGFQLAPYYRYSNTASFYTELHVEYNLNGLLTNKIPLLRQARWNVVTGNNTLYIDRNNYYTEAFIGIDNLGYKILRFLRVDVVRSWDHGQVHTGVRIGIDQDVLSGASGISEDKENFEW